MFNSKLSQAMKGNKNAAGKRGGPGESRNKTAAAGRKIGGAIGAGVGRAKAVGGNIKIGGKYAKAYYNEGTKNTPGLKGIAKGVKSAAANVARPFKENRDDNKKTIAAGRVAGATRGANAAYKAQGVGQKVARKTAPMRAKVSAAASSTKAKVGKAARSGKELARYAGQDIKSAASKLKNRASNAMAGLKNRIRNRRAKPTQP